MRDLAELEGSEPAQRVPVPVRLEAPSQRPPRWQIVAAFAAVYLIWGSTYLGIRVAVQTLPPFLMAGARFTVAGLVLYAWARWRGAPSATPRHWRSAAIVGALLLPLGNGALSWAEKYVATGICALLLAATPLWLVLADWLRPGGRAPGPRVAVGLLLGFLGVALIVQSRDAAGHRHLDPIGAAILIAAPAAWAIGSIYSRHAPQAKSSLLNVGMQMICGGGMMLLIGLVLGEGRALDLRAVTAASWWALAYLSVMGSLVGFTAYVWLLQVSSPARVSTYAYVNPLIAVLLGRWFLHEPLSPLLIGAGGLILGAVLALTSAPKRV